MKLSAETVIVTLFVLAWACVGLALVFLFSVFHQCF